VTADYLDLAGEVVRKATAKGADQCDCIIEAGREMTIKIRSGGVESIERASFRGLGIRFFSKLRLGFGYTTDFSADSIARLIEGCRDFAEAATPDPAAGIPRPEKPGAGDLEINDPSADRIPLADKIDYLLACEAAARGYDKRIAHVYSVAYEEQKGRMIIATMNSDPIFYDATGFEVFCAPVAEDAGEKRMGVWGSDARFYGDLESAEEVGKTAARRAVALIGATTPATQKATVVFDTLTGGEVAAEIFHGLDGERILKGMSFLKDKMGRRVAPESVTFADDGRMPRRLGTRPFDGEGIPTRRVAAIDGGVVRSFFYDCRSARKAGASPGGNARRGFASIPQVGENNFYLAPGKMTRDDLIAGVDEGLLVMRMLGFGVNLTTGDYSRGAEGLWIKNGKIDRPVDGVTIAGNLSDMLGGLEGVASDLRFFGRFGCPTFAISRMTVAGT
jgi:PmbA protein